MILTRKQIKQLREIFKEDKGLRVVNVREDGDNGIGPVIYVEYVDINSERQDIDITDYENW
jgi:hypothetical protein